MIYRFGPFELDERAGELRRGGEAVDVQPKPLALLFLLVRERDRVVSQEELFDALWPGTAVTPGSLTRAVSHARRALGDTHRGSLLRSVPRRGYRFTADVVELPGVGGSGVVRDEDTRASGAAPAVAPSGDATSVPAAGGPFVGRRDVLQRLQSAWSRARAGAGRLLLVGGPAGIGKTRLCEEFARELTELGALVLFGRCREGEGVPAFWLWSEILRGLSDSGGADAAGDWRALLARAGDAADAEQRFLFFDSVARVLLEAGRKRPLALVLEDLQWAQSPSLRLLEHLCFELGHSRLLVVGTVRSEVREPDHPVNRTLPALRKHECCEQIELSGLSRADIGSLLRRMVGRPPPAELTSEIFARTEGVPLFVREVVRLLEDRGDLKRPERIRRRGITLPDHAVDLIRRSLESLSPECAELVAAGSVLGRDFTGPAAAAVAGVERGAALDRLDEAVAAGVIEEHEKAAAAYRFSHALFREAAYEGLQAGRRARMHARAAERLESQYAEDPTPVVAELAHHHHQSIAVGDAERAFRCAVAAAEEATRLFAYEQAARHYEQAVDALEHCETVDARRRLGVLIELGEAHRRAGDRERRREVSARAMESARALGLAGEFARAAIRFCDLNEWSPEDPAARTAVDEALQRLGDAEPELRARLTARQAYLGIRNESAKETARQAAALARETGHPETLQEALYVLLYALAGPDHLDERRSLGEELARAARRSRSHETAVIALLDIACDFLTVGDPEGARLTREGVTALIGDRPSPSIEWHTRVFDAGRRLLVGQLEDAEQAMTDALLLGRRIDHPYAQACFNGQQMQLHRYRQDHAAILPVFERAIHSSVGATHWARAVVARTLLQTGDTARASELFEGLAASGFRDVARGIRWVGTIAEIAHLCADLDDGRRAETLIPLLASGLELHSVLPIPVLYGGPLCYALARLQQVLGMAEDASRHYERALEGAIRLGARPMQARIQQDYAGLLARRGDGERARALADEGRALAEQIGCHL